MQQGDATETEETCTQYNMLKIARYLFRWTGNVTYADYYERAITNGLLGTQRMPADNPTPDWPPASTQANATSKEKGLLSMPASAMGSEAQSGR